jgi:hypothetical protein
MVVEPGPSARSFPDKNGHNLRAEVTKALKTLHEPGDVMELRALGIEAHELFKGED